MLNSLLKTFDFIPPKEIGFWDKVTFFNSFRFAKESPEYFYQVGVLFFVWFVVGSMLFTWYMDGKRMNYRPVLFACISVWVLFIFVLGKMTGALINPLNSL